MYPSTNLSFEVIDVVLFAFAAKIISCIASFRILLDEIEALEEPINAHPAVRIVPGKVQSERVKTKQVEPRFKGEANSEDARKGRRPVHLQKFINYLK